MDTQNTIPDIAGSTWEETGPGSASLERQGLSEDEFRLLLEELSPLHAAATAAAGRPSAELTPFQKTLVDAGLGRDLLLGQYVLEDKLGEGGMGVVYRAVHLGMDRRVALKILSPKLTGDRASVFRFLQEVRALSRLSHPNVVTAFDACHSSDRHFLVMEYVEGADLDSIVSHKGPLLVSDVIQIGMQVCDALEFVHRRGIIHRDIKPSNLLVDSSGYVKVMDLGLAKLEADLEGRGPTAADNRITQPGVLMGTVDFLSPEQARDTRSATGQSDIYSLGCTLYFLLTGRAPYQAETVLDCLIAHRGAPIPSLRETRRDIPKSLDRLIRCMLAKAPHDRPASMHEIRESLSRLGRDFGSCRESLARLAAECTPESRRLASASSALAFDTSEQWDDPSTHTVICPVESPPSPSGRFTQTLRNILRDQGSLTLDFKDWLLLAAIIVASLALVAS